MFLIAMHNKDSYLDSVESILREKGIERISRIKRNYLRIPTGDNELVSGINLSSSKKNYEQAVVATIRQEKFINLYEALQTIDSLPEFKNEKGFITTLPYEQIVEAAWERKEGHMEISDYLRVKFVCSELKATTKDEAIRELTGLVKGCPEIVNFNQFVEDVFAREAMQTTGIGYEVAIPHARTDAVNKFIFAIGRSHKGIDFSSIDDQPVNLILLMGIPKDTVRGYLQVLAYLTRLLKKSEFRKQLLEAKDEQAIINVFEGLNK